MGASVMVNDGVLDPEYVEAMACREALVLRQDLNLRAAVVASDCANVVRSVEEGSRGMSSMVIEEIRRMKMTAGEVSFRYERREANFDAHNIATPEHLLNWCQAVMCGFWNLLIMYIFKSINKR